MFVKIEMNGGGAPLAWSRVRHRDLGWRFFLFCLDGFFSSCSYKLSCWSCRCCFRLFFYCFTFFFFPASVQCSPADRTKNIKRTLYCLCLSFFLPFFRARLIQFNKFLRAKASRSARALKGENYHGKRVVGDLLPF